MQTCEESHQKQIYYRYSARTLSTDIYNVQKSSLKSGVDSPAKLSSLIENRMFLVGMSFQTRLYETLRLQSNAFYKAIRIMLDSINPSNSIYLCFYFERLKMRDFFILNRQNYKLA